MFRPRPLDGLCRLVARRGRLVATALRLPRPGPAPAWARGKKTTTTVVLPQGPIRPDAKPLLEAEEPREPAYPTVVLQAWRNMRRFDNCVLLTRVGGFYELYFEHAQEYAPLLDIKLASKKTNAGAVPMAGFPFFQLDRYLKMLVQDHNRYVAIAEEFPNDAADRVKSGDLMHDRRVTRIVTAGTLIDENFIDPYDNNYVLAIHVHERDPATPARPAQPPGILDLPVSPVADSTPLGLAWLDLSTGHFFTQASDLASLPSALSRISPREVVLDRSLKEQKQHPVSAILADDRLVVTYSPGGELVDLGAWTPFLEAEMPQRTRKSFSEQEVLAGGLVLNYVKDRLQGMSMKLQPPRRYEGMDIMSIDKNSMRALEIKQTIRDGFFRGSLLHAIRRTVTKSGARLLNDWLGAPSTSLDVINERQNLVAHFVAAEDLRDSIRLQLGRSDDSQRLVQKFAMGRGSPDDLLALANTIQATKDIVDRLTQESDQADQTSAEDPLEPLTSRIDLVEPLKLAGRIRAAIDEEGIDHQHQVEESEAGQMMALAQDIVAAEGSPEDAGALPKERKRRPPSIRDSYREDNDAWIMKPAASPSLKKLHDKLGFLLEEKTELERTLRESLGATSLTLKWTPGLGHIAHIKGKDARQLADIKTLTSTRSTRSFQNADWTALGQRLDQARFQIRREEQRVFQQLRERVVKNLVRLRRNAAVLDELDIALSFAKLAVEQAWVRPRLDDSAGHVVMAGRHPTVECGLAELGKTFVRNDCLVGGPSAGRLWLITGPNMAGKSTFLRQNALITILAQIGCYVPAAYAELGLVDAVFSRVGSADNLYRDQSTFMVEMTETAHILRHATPKSFVIMDEIGRGTTPDDGTAVSYACLHHLVTVNKCRTLFATHFHDVADLAVRDGLCRPDGGPVQMYSTDVEEDGEGHFVYVHKLRKGINRRSHALKVAKMAGLPDRAIDMAEKIMAGGNYAGGGLSGEGEVEAAAVER
ncbi:hypothetical protein CDD83_7367 [Cordyceps sp. RAO-2017]|nr:hypothetical protein CDD83_7367 [Cordyceps sp. RAO-2017]